VVGDPAGADPAGGVAGIGGSACASAEEAAAGMAASAAATARAILLIPVLSQSSGPPPFAIADLTPRFQRCAVLIFAMDRRVRGLKKER
jgi:hypothetical protein